jgi:thiamine-phosphate pyrophosphorylase
MRSEARGPLRGLYAITPEIADTARLVSLVIESLAGGAALVQYRSKSAPPELALAQSRALLAECRKHGALFIVNDSVELALASNADGVHLGRDDAGVRAARAALPGAIIGVSCYADPSLAGAALEAGADYVAIGSVFASPTKPRAARAPLETLREAKRISGLPVAAIGGITAGNAGEAIAAGADMLAVISALFEAPDVRSASRNFSRLFETPAPSPPHARPQPRPV